LATDPNCVAAVVVVAFVVVFEHPPYRCHCNSNHHHHHYYYLYCKLKASHSPSPSPFQKPIANILTNIAQKAGQQSTPTTPSAQQQQQ
jgi:hypothetical protein